MNKKTLRVGRGATLKQRSSTANFIEEHLRLRQTPYSFRHCHLLRSFIGFRPLLFCSPRRSARVLPDTPLTHARGCRSCRRGTAVFAVGVPLSIPWRRKIRRQTGAP